jgi:hypothetical protein
MDAHEYLIMERALADRLDEARRFALEQPFHSEAAADDEDDDPGPPNARVPDVEPRRLSAARCCA